MTQQAQIWNAGQYLKFGGLRTRPAADLLGQVHCEAPEQVVDLGCGPGNSTALLCARWAGAQVTGIDNAPDMLAKAGASDVPARWEKADIATYRAEHPVDVLYSNAAFQWIDGHATLFPHLMASVKSGGWLAVQMPRNFQAPSHVLMRETAKEEPFSVLLDGVLQEDPVGDPADYYDLLAAGCAHLDIWETIYTQVLDGDDPVLEWVRGTALVPVQNALSGDLFEQFVQTYGAKLRKAYPKQKNGKTIFPFKRIFIVAHKG